MRAIVAVALLLYCTAALAGALTVSDVVAAQRAGTTQEALLALVNAADSVEPVSTAGLAMLRDAGVTEPVIQALQARAPAAPPAAAASAVPDDARLMDIVRLVRTGLSAALVIEQVNHSGQTYKPTVNDLSYLKDNEVPEAIISALLTGNTTPPSGTGGTASNPTALATTAPLADVTFEPLVRIRGIFKSNDTGSLALKNQRLEWYDNTKSERNFSLLGDSIKSAWLECEPRAQGNFCSELAVATMSGDTFRFRDVGWKAGENAKTLAIFASMKARFPKIVYQEQVKN